MAQKDQNIALFKDLGLTDAQIELVLPSEEEELALNPPGTEGAYGSVYGSVF